MWVEFVVGSILALLRGFLSGFSGFPLSVYKNQHLQIPIPTGQKTRMKTSQG